MTRDIQSLARLQLVPSVYCHVEIYYVKFDTVKVVMHCKRSGITFTCGIKLCNTLVQRHKGQSLCHSDYAPVFFCNFTL